jgi:hypothetical protein
MNNTAQVNVLKLVYQKYREQSDVIQSILLTAQDFKKEPASVAEALGLLEHWNKYGGRP